MNSIKRKNFSLKEIQNNLSEFRNNLISKRADIFSLLDKDSIPANIDDFEFCINYIGWLIENKHYIVSAKKIKPYGRTLVLLPSNEPIKMAIIPVISGLFCGVQVDIQCHNRAGEVQSLIYNQLIKSGFENITVLPFKNPAKRHKKLRKLIIRKYYKNIVCFTSHKVAEKIGKICLKGGINFHFECEGNDWLVLDYCPSDRKELIKIIEAVTYHEGKMCNCLKGILIRKDYYAKFSQEIKKIMELEGINFKIFENPSITAKAVQNPDFKPSLWIKPFNNYLQLLKYLDMNKNRLILHIRSKNKKFIRNVLDDTSFARYNLAFNLLNIAFCEPWGGIFWSGNKGPIHWYQRFGYTPFIKLK